MTGYTIVKVGDKRRAEHRLVMEAKIGRPLTRVEVVHHINRDPSDNSPENLILCPSQSAHRKTHALENLNVKNAIRSISIRPDQDAWLKAHKELNFSAFIQKKLDEEIEKHA